MRRRSSGIVVCAIFAALAASPLAALTPAKAIRQYVAAAWLDQLPHATVPALAQTHDGYLWVGTYEGLARFNGSDFTVFDKRNTPLESVAIATLFEDSGGTLWIGTISGGLYRYKDGTVTRLASPAVGATIRALAEDRERTLWVAGDRGIARLERDGARALPLPPGAPRTTVRSICAAGGDVWFATEGEGLVRYAGGRFDTVATTGNVIFALLAARDGRLLIGSQHGGLDVYAGGQFTKPAAAVAVAQTSLFALAEDRDGNVWMS